MPVTSDVYGSGTDLDWTGVSPEWGFSAADIFTNGMFLVSSVAAFVLLGIAIRYVPTLIGILKSAVRGRR